MARCEKLRADGRKMDGPDLSCAGWEDGRWRKRLLVGVG